MIVKQLLRNTAYKTFGSLDAITHRESQHVILCYHGIGNEDFRFTVPKEYFTKQILSIIDERKYIKGCELENRLLNLNAHKQKTFTLTFDDGYRNILSIKDFLNDLGIKPLVFILPFDAKPNTTEFGQEFEMLRLDDVKGLIADGWEIGCHSYTHANFDTIPATQLRHEIIDSKVALEKDLGIPVNYFSYPKGKYNELCEQLITEAGYNMVFTMDDSIINQKTNIHKIPRIGVDKTHGVNIFNLTIKPENIRFRQLVKSLGISGL